MKAWLKTWMVPRAKDNEVDLLLKYYPDDQRAGCPFDTGLKNARSMLIDFRDQNWVFIRCLGPQFKRTAAIQGDFVFHAPRRFLLNYRADKQKSWGFSTCVV